MKYEGLFPKKDQYSNGVLKGNSFSEVLDLPVTHYVTPRKEHVVCSHFRLSFWQRIKFVFCGRIYVHVIGKTHAPLAVGIGEFFNLSK